VLKCVNLVQEVGLMSGTFKNNGSGSVQSVPQSPIGVLDVTCFSYKSDDHTTVGSCANSFHNGSDTKRRKLNRSYEVEL
jgi:cyclin D1/2/4